MLLRLSTVLLTNFFCFAFFGPTGYAQWVYEDEVCQVPDRGLGNCIPLAQCAPMVNALNILKNPISQTASKKLRAYTCGHDGTEIKVCCHPGPIALEPDRNSIQNGDGPPDVSKHRNLYLLPENCGYLDANHKVRKRENAALNEFPWMALLRYKGRKGLTFNCGGTIINKNYILTAGHCISSELVSVRVGEHSIQNETDCEIVDRKRTCNPPVQDLTIEEVIPHPQFGRKSLLNDIGLIRVSTINLDTVNAKPVCLPLGNLSDYISVVVTGWGNIDSQKRQISDILQKVKLEVVDKESCIRTYETHNITLSKEQLCAGGLQNKDACLRISGGPALVTTIDDSQKGKYVEEGVVSAGPILCGTNYPDIHTLVKYYMDWILDTMRP